MFKKNKLIIFSLFFLFTALCVFADKVPVTIEAAAALEKQQKYEQAQVVYEEWLKTNQNDPRFFDILKKCGSLKKNTFHIIELYTKYLPNISEKEKKKELLVHIGVQYAMLGNYRKARDSFITAFSPVQGAQKELFILAPAQFSLLYGDPDEALSWIQEVYPLLSYETDKAEALYLLVEIGVMKNNGDYAEEVIQKLKTSADSTPAYTRALYRIIFYFKSKKDVKKQELYEKELKDKFPSSPEYLSLADNSKEPDIVVMALPHEFIEFQSEKYMITENSTSEKKEEENKVSNTTPSVKTEGDKIYSIQIGSYTMQENAHFILLDATKLGFTGKIIETQIRGKTYYRVLIGNNLSSKEAQETLARLNDKGFSGFLYSID